VRTMIKGRRCAHAGRSGGTGTNTGPDAINDGGGVAENGRHTAPAAPQYQAHLFPR
jgi:hypothetical protein